MSFHIGQKVVCVDASMTPRNGPVEGGVYTIASLERAFVELAELPGRSWFRARFRPITERKTDISIFKRILADCDQRVDAPCDVEV